MLLEETKTVLLEFWFTIGDMSPYLLFGFLIAGILSDTSANAGSGNNKIINAAIFILAS